MFQSRIYKNVNSADRCHGSQASRFAACILPLALFAIASGAQAADGKGNTTEEARQGSGVQIESVIGSSERAPTLELLQEGFTIECSSRFESGCKLFLKGN